MTANSTWGPSSSSTNPNSTILVDSESSRVGSWSPARHSGRETTAQRGLLQGRIETTRSTQRRPQSGSEISRIAIMERNQDSKLFQILCQRLAAQVDLPLVEEPAHFRLLLGC